MPTAILWYCITVVLIIEMKKFDIGKADFLKDTHILPLRRRDRILLQAFGYMRWCFHVLHYLWKVVFYKYGLSSISIPTPLPETWIPSSGDGAYFPSSWSCVGILAILASSSAGEVMSCDFAGLSQEGHDYIYLACSWCLSLALSHCRRPSCGSSQMFMSYSLESGNTLLYMAEGTRQMLN